MKSSRPYLLAMKLTLAGLLSSLLLACSGIPYKTDVTQGNFISKEQISALQLGMPRGQVLEILGTPLLVSVFHADRWEYVFTLKRQGVTSKPYKITVHFKGDALDKIDGEGMLTEQEFVESLSGNKK